MFVLGSCPYHPLIFFTLSLCVIPDQRAPASAEPESSTNAKTRSVLFLIFKIQSQKAAPFGSGAGYRICGCYAPLSGMTMKMRGGRTYAHRHCASPQEAWQSSLSSGGMSGLLRCARNDKGCAQVLGGSLPLCQEKFLQKTQ
jgi:hypothetical protein